MKILPLTALLTLSLAAAQTTQAQTTQPIPAELRARYEALRDATLKGDLQAVRAFYLPDARLTDVNGQPLSLNAALEALNPQVVTFEKLTYELRGAVLSGDQATVQVWQRVEGKVTPLPGTSQAFGGDALSEDLWRKVNGEWLIAGSRALESETRIAGQVIRQRAPAPVSDTELVARRAALAGLARPLSTLDPAARNAEFSWLGELVKGVRVLGAGEGSHGTAEHFQLKDRVFRELVRDHGFTVLALEDSYASGDAVDRYVRGEGPDDADAATAQLEIGVWQTQEVRDLLRWMRAYNAARGDRPELRVVGIDMQMPTTSVAVLTQLAPQNPRLQAALAPLRPLEPQFWFALAEDKDEARYARLLGQITELRRAVDALPAGTPQRAQLVHLAETVRQGATFWRGLADFSRANLIRDAAMGANTRSAFDTLFPGQRGMLWAHNFHVSKVPAQGQTYANLGQHLARAWGGAYRALGFSFAGGEVRAVSTDPAKQREGFVPMSLSPAPETSLDALIASEAPAAYLNTAQALATPALRGWFSAPLGVAAVGATYAPGSTSYANVNLPQAFDGMIFVKRSTATKLLEKR
ncbi:erythromycin esterase [Deinococcus reticulitermitis]|uniref:Erythromycin esterase n=1 Tax=Deinococcus reticulitermitis TaxID=856736 RepID=A0A1H7A4Q9_9DEIO|nr:erythromycin esterase family protein [Deinococcus reticulitermitis]SEJ59896.1 erythromycin esterase [Deinococcus reticulitermitis]